MDETQVYELLVDGLNDVQSTQPVCKYDKL